MIRAIGTAVIVSALLAGGGTIADDFEQPLARQWIASRPERTYVASSGDAQHHNVLVLEPDGDDVYVLLKETERANGGILEADVLFPSAEDNYLGIIYNFQKTAMRTDFGVIYIKGNESYAQANPHYDFNVSRTIYPEARVTLTGPAAVEIGRWQHVKLEVAGGDCHLYVGDMTTPQLTFSMFHGRGGAFGLQPRSVGGAVWVDNVQWRPLSTLTYTGAPKPTLRYAPDTLLTSWQVAGPFDRVEDAIARQPAGSSHAWRPFAADPRGAVISGRVTAFHHEATVAYFRTRIQSAAARSAMLELSTADDLAVWLNGRFWWFVPRAGAAWFDFLTNQRHAGQQIPLDLAAGSNDLVIRVRGGSYATGGFFAAVK